jgi:allophanate hydrolase
MSALDCLSCGPGVTVQDMGRTGALALGLSRGGAMDVEALAEGAALLGQGTDLAALEMAGMGGRFRARGDLVIALTGAPMRAALDGRALAWNASHAVPDGAVLDIGPALRGVYGYLSVAGGLDTAPVLGARSAHLAAGIGARVAAGDVLPVAGGRARAGRVCVPRARFAGGTVRVMDSPQSDLFPAAALDWLTATAFRRDNRGNRMGLRLDPETRLSAQSDGLSVLSDIVMPGDIQMTGDGSPFVLMAECQTTGGYPRIATVLPCDRAIVAQAAPGTAIRFERLEPERARALHRDWQEGLERIATTDLVRDPKDMNLNEYQLVSGVTSGKGETE